MEKKGPLEISELKSKTPGTQVWGKFLILEKVQRKTRDGKSILHLKLGDPSGDIDAVVWENCSIEGGLEPGTVIGCLGDVGRFSNRLQLTARKIKHLPEEDVYHYLKSPPRDLDELIRDFESLQAKILDPFMVILLERIFTSPLREAFFQAPAAKRFHHNYGGGLLEHTVAVARLCLQSGSFYPDMNRDLLLTGALLHDIGKLCEYDMNITPEFTPQGRLLGHIMMGAEKISGNISALRLEGHDFPAELEWMLKHMILSHHGSLEFGSPVIPQFPEALLLHMMDNLDAKMHVFRSKIDDDVHLDPFFTAYDGLLGQSYFKYKYPGKTE